jgi:outer membrane lipoprotein-sorting protein
MRPTLRALFLVLLAANATFALGQRGGRVAEWQDDLLQEVLDTNGNLRCKGIRKVTFRFVRDGKPGTNSFTEVIVRDGQKSRTEYTGNSTFEGQIAVDDGRNRSHYFPKENVIHRGPSLQHQNSERLDMLMRERRAEYTVTVGDGGRVADYNTWLITLKSESGREHKIWVERSRKAILKRELSGPEKDRGMSYYFESFEYKRRVDDDEFKISKPGAKVLDPEDRLALAAKKVDYAPFTISGDSKFKLYESSSFEVNGSKVLRSTFSDGRLVVTLHQVRGSIDAERLKGRDKDRVRVHVWRLDGYNFALVGDLPAQELERLAKLVRR